MIALLRLVVVLPGLLVIQLVDRPHGPHGLGALNRVTRGAVHVFVWTVLAIALWVLAR